MSGELTFLFEGRPMVAREGDTVAAALIANGVHVFGRSSKYHRPRGYRCGRGHCSSCAMRVDGLPGVRTCVTPVRPGMTVEREHAWPRADRDLLRAAELASPLMPPGFYYRWFRRSPRLWSALERGLAQVAGQGEMPSREAVERLGAARCARRAVDVLVIGGGVAGMSAALAAAAGGADVLLVARGDRLGGGLADDVMSGAAPAGAAPDGAAPDGAALTAAPAGAGLAADLAAAPAGARLAADLAARVTSDGRITVITAGDAVAWYEEGTIAVDLGLDLLLVDPAAVVLASGAYDGGQPFPNWDLPGVMTVTAACRLSGRYGVLPGSRAVIVTEDDRAYGAVLQLVERGMDVACIADYRGVGSEGAERGAGFEGDSGAAREARGGHPFGDRGVLAALAARDVDLLTGLGSLTVRGVGRVRSVTLCPADRPGRSLRRPRDYACDVVCYSGGVRPADELAYQARASGSLVLAVPEGAAPGHLASVASPLAAPRGGDEARDALRQGLWLAGLVAGASSAEEAAAQGEAAGVAAAERALQPQRRSLPSARRVE